MASIATAVSLTTIAMPPSAGATVVGATACCEHAATAIAIHGLIGAILTRQRRFSDFADFHNGDRLYPSNPSRPLGSWPET
jgi:hypothetical protein